MVRSILPARPYGDEPRPILDGAVWIGERIRRRNSLTKERARNRDCGDHCQRECTGSILYGVPPSLRGFQPALARACLFGQSDTRQADLSFCAIHYRRLRTSQ
jgi:hypothetical protein